MKRANQTHKPDSSRNALTMMEVLVAIAIIGVLIAILVPAIVYAREAARRARCKGNLKQICLAMHNYHDAFREFPLNYGNGYYDGTNTGASWMQMILPYVEHENLYSTIKFGFPVDDPINRGVAETVVSIWLCPSDGELQGKMDKRANVAGPLAVNNYKASSGSNWNWGTFAGIVSSKGRHANDPDGLDHCNGLICRGGDNQPVKTRMAFVKDGLGNTFALGEAVPLWSAHTWWYWFNGSTATCAIPLNYRNIPETSIADWHEHNGFQSHHDGGGHFAMADGRVRFVQDDIDLDLYRALATIQSGEAKFAF